MAVIPKITTKPYLFIEFQQENIKKPGLLGFFLHKSFK